MVENFDISAFQDLKLHGLKDPLFFDKIDNINININRYSARADIAFVDSNTIAYHSIDASDFPEIVKKIHEFLEEIKSQKG